MDPEIIDARGQVCPMPLIMTKKAIKDLGPGRPLSILIDNDTSKGNVERFLIDNGMIPLVDVHDGVFTITINGAPAQLSHPDAEAYCTPSPASASRPHVILIKSDKLGSGPDELGAILMKAFVNTLHEVQPLPASIVFYTTGVLLTAESSPVLDSLLALERAGVTMLVCGTCADYFQIKPKVRVGTISNMYSILETLTAAGQVLVP